MPAKRKTKRKVAPRSRARRRNPAVKKASFKSKGAARTYADRRALYGFEVVGIVYNSATDKYEVLWRKRAKNPAATRPAKLGRWYKGPKGTRVRVRKLKGKIVVDVKK